MAVNFKWHSAITYSSLVSSISLSLKQLIHLFTFSVKRPTVSSSLTDDLAVTTTDLYDGFPYSVGDMLQDPQWVPETMGSTEPQIYYVFSYIGIIQKYCRSGFYCGPPQ